jgi:Holliday junction resolvase RusA-like endonuclease
MNPLEIVILGPPVGKERPRVNRKTGGVYTPRKTKIYERHVGQMAASAIYSLGFPDRKSWPLESGQVIVNFWIYMSTALEQAHEAPDADNVVKAVADGMEKVVYKNDRQVIPRVWKFSYNEPSPRVELTITRAKDDSGVWNRNLLAEFVERYKGKK